VIEQPVRLSVPRTKSHSARTSSGRTNGIAHGPANAKGCKGRPLRSIVSFAENEANRVDVSILRDPRVRGLRCRSRPQLQDAGS